MGDKSIDELQLQRETFDYFLNEVNPANGLILDKTAANWPASIAATSLALACYPVAVQRGLMTREAAGNANAGHTPLFLAEPARPRGPGPRDVTASSITLSTWRPDAAPGNASCRRLTAPPVCRGTGGSNLF